MLLSIPLIKKNLLPSPKPYNLEIEDTKNSIHGDFSTNLAMQRAKIYKLKPLKIAKIITDEINDTDNILKKIEIAGPGFINFFIKENAWHKVLKQINKQNHNYGRSNIGHGKRIQIEFVSSNPTGPLHVGHGRGAAIGDSMANILSACGYNVHKEYYINDSGRQISTLGLSVYFRAKNILDSTLSFPEQYYQGEYIKILAKKFIKKEKTSIFKENKEIVINKCANYASKKIIKQIHNDLSSFGVNFNSWFSEKSLFETGKVDEALEYYQQKGLIYKKNGATWFSTTKFGDEKDRVVVRKNGLKTYFASDIAYHKNKFDRGFEEIINVWGADHHGYIPRITASIEASGKNKKQLKIILVKLVNLLRNGKSVAMSTREGQFITLNEVVNEVGTDAARFLFLTRHHESSLDFDIELAKKKSNDNPVYYVQYVYARISKMLNKGQKRGIIDFTWNSLDLKRITTEEELLLIKKMAVFPETIKTACRLMEPHRIAFYLIELASIFHKYYSKERVLSNDLELSKGRLYLALSIKKVIRNGLKLLGVSTPEKM